MFPFASSEFHAPFFATAAGVAFSLTIDWVHIEKKTNLPSSFSPLPSPYTQCTQCSVYSWIRSPSFHQHSPIDACTALHKHETPFINISLPPYVWVRWYGLALEHGPWQFGSFPIQFLFLHPRDQMIKTIVIVILSLQCYCVSFTLAQWNKFYWMDALAIRQSLHVAGRYQRKQSNHCVTVNKLHTLQIPWGFVLLPIAHLF